MKKLILLLLLLAMLIPAGCAKPSTEPPATGGDIVPESTVAPGTQPPATAADLVENVEKSSSSADLQAVPKYKVALITDLGGINDGSFNQAAYEGCVEFCTDNTLSVKYYKPEESSTDARLASIAAAAEEGRNIIVCPGFSFANTILTAADTYPECKFILIDVSEDDLLSVALGEEYDGIPENYDIKDYLGENVYAAVYREEIAGFFAGYAAVKLGCKQPGFLGGMDIPSVQRYGQGFVQGCKLADPDIAQVEYAYTGQFTADDSITDLARQWYDDGVDVIFACGGEIYKSIAEAAAEHEGVKMIGVDVDQSALIDAYGQGICLSSAMKDIGGTVYMALEKIINGEWSDIGGTLAVLGLSPDGDLSKSFVGLPLESTQWNEAYTRADYEAFAAEIAADESLMGLS